MKLQKVMRWSYFRVLGRAKPVHLGLARMLSLVFMDGEALGLFGLPVA